MNCWVLSEVARYLTGHNWIFQENDLTKTEGSEQDKLKAIMMQQAMAYDNPNA